MDPIGSLRTTLTNWLDASPLAKGLPKPTRNPEPAELRIIDQPFDAEMIRNLVQSDASRAEPEPAVPVVVGKPYTDNVNEVALARTDPSTRQLVQALAKGWPELSEKGARTLAGQHLLETGGGSSSWNWNLGNMKAAASQPHMYLRDTWEVLSPAEAKRSVDGSNRLARIVPDDEVKARGWSCQPGSQVVVFQPPHPTSRFRAFSSLAEGVAGWESKYKTLAQRSPSFLTALNSGDPIAVAHALAEAHYYTGDEDKYGAGLKRWQPAVDAAIGWTP